MTQHELDTIRARSTWGALNRRKPQVGHFLIVSAATAAVLGLAAIIFGVSRP